MTKVYLIRHGKTQWNLESRYQGANGDSPLLDQSYKEIELLAESLKTQVSRWNMRFMQSKRSFP